MVALFLTAGQGSEDSGYEVGGILTERGLHLDIHNFISS